MFSNTYSDQGEGNLPLKTEDEYVQSWPPPTETGSPGCGCAHSEPASTFGYSHSQRISAGSGDFPQSGLTLKASRNERPMIVSLKTQN